ncbi:MAG: methyltransferase domain-containing protein [Rhizobiaceae bacterium]
MFNPALHRLRLMRARKKFVAGDDFLMHRAVDDILERLSAVNMEFEDAVLLFGRTDDIASKVASNHQIHRLARIEEEGEPDLAHQIAQPDQLGLLPKSANLVIAPLTLHWSNDLPGSLIQILRALKPNGLLLASLPGPDTLSELRQSMLQAESELTGGAGRRIDPFTDIRDAGALLQRAGFSIPVVDQETVTVRYDTALDLIRDLRRFGATLQLENNSTPRLNRAVFARMNEIYLQKFSDSDGRIRATFSMVSLSGWSPHESQQKPLKPGSAKTRLADALKVQKFKLDD